MDEDNKIIGNNEIDKALKDFEEKSTREETEILNSPSVSSDIPKIVRLVIKLSGGTISSKQAEYFLFIVVVIALVISGVVLWQDSGLGKVVKNGQTVVPAGQTVTHPFAN